MVGKEKKSQKNTTQKHKSHFWSWITVKLAFTSVGLFLITFGVFSWLDLSSLPSPYELKENMSQQTTIIRDNNGQVLYRIYGDENRLSLNYEKIPEVVKNATIAIEDSDFYNHQGISIKSILRAALQNLKKDDITNYQGGSTITQQLIKNKLLAPEKSYQRKIREIILALWTEKIYSKQEILAMYLNEISYGGLNYGIQAAAQTYFNKPVADLTLGETAYLSGLPVSPSTFFLSNANPQLAKNRQRLVLQRMFKLAMISRKQMELAEKEKLVFAPQKVELLAPHFVMHVKQMLVERYGEEKTIRGGLDVTTTLDLDIQNKAEEIVKKQMENIKKSSNIRNAAVLVTDPQSGQILAMVGSVDYFDLENKGNVNVTTSLRQPGSVIKPVNYSYAFDHGYSPASIIDDSPVIYTSPNAKTYVPINYDGKFHGNVTIRSALANSYNIPAIKVLNSYGVVKMLDMGKKLGIESWEKTAPIGLSLTLGGLEVTMIDIARVYGTIANAGVRQELKSITTIRDYQNQDITSSFYQNEDISLLVGQVSAAESDNLQVISPLSAYWLTDILSDNRARQATFGSNSKLTIPKHKVAVKTGTSNNFRDNWTIGFTPDYLVAVWVGNNDGSFMNKRLVSGVTGAAPIWNEVMTNLLADSVPKDFAKPDGLTATTICAVDGLLTCANCPMEKVEYFPVNRAPTKACIFRPVAECDEAKIQSEGKTDEEKKSLLLNCPPTN